MAFLEIGTDKEHVHFLVQSVPSYSPTKIVQLIKSLTAREIVRRVPTVKQRLWGGEFWSKGYCISPVGRHGNEAAAGHGKRVYAPASPRRPVGIVLRGARRIVARPACLSPPNWRAMAVHQRGVDTSQLAAG